MDVTHPVHKAMALMADRVAKKSGGKLQIEVYPSQQLGRNVNLSTVTDRQLCNDQGLGSGVGKLYSQGPVFSLPYLFRTDEHRFSVLDGEIGRDLLLTLVGCEESPIMMLENEVSIQKPHQLKTPRI
ncbi:MAG: hypothetical protein U5K69_30185 [Balneolaceae bacterium]|nr:hypothetical protein [Balneolaceae bacterium]